MRLFFKSGIMIVILSLLASTSYCQEKKIDSLIKLLNNNAISVNGNFIGPYLMLIDSPAVELRKMGKRVTKQLFEILDDTTKGVVAHYMLTMIWRTPIKPEEMIHSDKDTLYFVSFNDLNFFIKWRYEPLLKEGYYNVYANEDDLISNKYAWMHYFRNKGILD